MVIIDHRDNWYGLKRYLFFLYCLDSWYIDSANAWLPLMICYIIFLTVTLYLYRLLWWILFLSIQSEPPLPLNLLAMIPCSDMFMAWYSYRNDTLKTSWNREWHTHTHTHIRKPKPIQPVNWRWFMHGWSL